MPRLLHVLTVPMTLRFLRGQVGFMHDQGYDVHVMCAPGAALDAFADAHPVTPHPLEITRRIDPFTDLRAVRAAAGTMRRIRPDIVHAHTPKGGLIGMLAAKAAGVPSRVYHLRGLPYLTASGWLRRALWGTESTSCSLAHRVFAVSHSLAAAARDARFAGAKKIRVLAGGSGNGVDGVRFDPSTIDRVAARAHFGIPPRATVLTFVGRLVRDKGIEELAAAWQRVKTPERRLLIVGPYEERDPVRREIREALANDDGVIHVEFTEDMPRVYAASDVLVLPTHREGFPNAPLEAAAMGLPVVTTDAVGATDSVVDGHTGAVVPVGDVDALATAMEAYASSRPLREAHGQAGRQRALVDYAPRRIWEALAAEYEALTTR